MNFRKIREYLIEEDLINEYIDIQNFLQNPTSVLKQGTVDQLVKINEKEFEDKIRSWVKSNPKEYRNKVLYGQVIIWQEVLNCFIELTRVEELLNNTQVVYFENDYLKSTEQVKKILNLYADAKVAITRLETHLGVDRYLDEVAGDDFELLIKRFDKIHHLSEEMLQEYKVLYTKVWNTTNVYEVAKHKLVRRNMSNQVCSLVQAKKKNLILFVIDGFGLGQYFWSKKVVPQNSNFAYSNNIFNWLNEEGLSNEYALGAPLVTDTAAGISQIFIGKTAKDTRVISSTLKKDGVARVVPVKNIDQSEFIKIVNTSYNGISADVLSENKQMKIYYCSKYDENNISGFSKFVFGAAEVQSIIPAERVFSFLKEDIKKQEDTMTVVYITSIDNSGHVMGSFSQFERYEHEKINTLFKNFLIEAAKNSPEIFDGNTSIMLTADHGMTESYRINISKFDLLDMLKIHNIRPWIIEGNRAEFLYNVNDCDIDSCKNLLQQYFDEKNIDVLILAKSDDLYDTFMPRPEWSYIDTVPSIIVLLISEGIFYSKDVGENLMHFGGHGGHSVDEVFVPLINIEMNERLKNAITERFLNLT